MLCLFSKFTLQLFLSCYLHYVCVQQELKQGFFSVLDIHLPLSVPDLLGEQALFDCPSADLALSISCKWLCILPFPAAGLRLARRRPRTVWEGDTPPDFHTDPDPMLGCLLTQSLVTRLERLLGSTTTSAAWLLVHIASSLARCCPSCLLSADPAGSYTQHAQANIPAKLGGD